MRWVSSTVSRCPLSLMLIAVLLALAALGGVCQAGGSDMKPDYVVEWVGDFTFRTSGLPGEYLMPEGQPSGAGTCGFTVSCNDDFRYTLSIALEQPLDTLQTTLWVTSVRPDKSTVRHGDAGKASYPPLSWSRPEMMLSGADGLPTVFTGSMVFGLLGELSIQSVSAQRAGAYHGSVRVVVNQVGGRK